MFTQSADHDNEDLNDNLHQQARTVQQQEELRQQSSFRPVIEHQPPEQTLSSLTSVGLRQEPSKFSSPPPDYSNISTATTATTNTITSNISSLSSPPPAQPPQRVAQTQPPPPPLSSRPQTTPASEDNNLPVGHEDGNSCSALSESPSTTSPNSIDNLYPQHRYHGRISTTSKLADTSNISRTVLDEQQQQQQQQYSGQQTLVGSSAHEAYQFSSLSSSLSSSALHHTTDRQRLPNKQAQSSRMLKWQGNDMHNTGTVTPINRQVSATSNVNNNNLGALFSNLDNTGTSTLAQPVQEELTAFQAATKAVSWNSLGHDHLYRPRHSSSAGQDYYRHLYQQRRFQNHHQQQPREMEAAFLQQDNHATKIMKLDGSISSSTTKQQQYQTHFDGIGSATATAASTGGSVSGGGPTRARNIQQIRFQHQPIRLSSSSGNSSRTKEFKENYSDEKLNYEDKRDVNYGHNQHLVKTISDLPVFVTIEDFRVASYTIAGEPHLCLPQLLQFLRQHFDTKKMVEKFEESLIHFPSATPKQVEGFIKSSCLHPSTKSCPLIKRSDADKICLSLFEELSNATETRPPGDIFSLCSEQQQRTQKYKDQEKHSDISNKSDKIKEEGSSCSISSPEKIGASTYELQPPINDQPIPETIRIQNGAQSIGSASKSHSPEDAIVQQEKDNSVVVASYKDDDKYATVKKKLKCNNDDTDLTKSDSSSTQDAIEDISRDGDRDEQIELTRDKISPNSLGDDGEAKQKAQKAEMQLRARFSSSISSYSSSSASSGATVRDTLFETEAQSSILNFARAVTSTLMIRVYHKCFGKCIGLFYPSLLKNRQMECIQCTSCRVMLTPRRFVGHTHGSKENDVCHWGFNSYNWRTYIRLSKKQPMNNLDEDELLNQFNTLITSTNDQTDRPDPSAAPNSHISTDKGIDTGHSYVAATTSAQRELNFSKHQSTRIMEYPTRTARSSNRHHAPGSPYASTSSGESTPQPLVASTSASVGQNASISTLRRFNTTDEPSSHTLHTSLSSSITTPSVAPKLDCATAQYTPRHAPGLDDRSFMRLARSSSLSGRMAPSECCSGGGLMIPPAPTRLTSQHSGDHFGSITGAMNPYPIPSASGCSMASSLLASSQSDQLTGDLRNFLLQNWSAQSTRSHPPSQPPVVAASVAAQLSMLPLGPLGLAVNTGQQACNNPLPPVKVVKPNGLQNDDLTKHLSLSAESKRELYVCTNLSTYLSRRGLSAGMTGDIVEKVLNLMRESRSTL